jgi:hypothetical protein
MAIGYVRLWRQQEFWDLVKDNQAFALAAVIAMRARRTTGLNMNGLDVGEALLGDYKEYGMTEGQYRAAKQRLEAAGFATFCTTNKGTIARLIFTGVFDPNLEQSNEPDNRPATDSLQRTSNEPNNRPATSSTTTNKDNEKDKGNIPCIGGESAADPVKDHGKCNLILHRPEMAVRVDLTDERNFHRADVTSIACTICDLFPDKSGKSGGSAGRMTQHLQTLASHKGVGAIGDAAASELVRQLLIRFWSELRAGEEPKCRVAVLLKKLERLLEEQGVPAEKIKKT